MKHRMQYIDTAKCIGIFLMVWGHASILYLPVRQLIYSFHMPLFFIVYGYAARKNPLPALQWKSFLVARITTYMVPAYIFSLIFFYRLEEGLAPFLSILLGYRESLGQMWFLPCLFVSALVFQLLVNLAAKAPGRARPWMYVSAAVLLFVVSMFWDARHTMYRSYPFSVNVAGMGVVLMLTGWLLRVFCDRLALMRSKAFSAEVLIPCCMLGAALTFLNRPALAASPNSVSMAQAHYGNPVLFVLAAAAFSLAVILLSALVSNRAFAYVGRNTIAVLSLHVILLNIVYQTAERLGILTYGAQSTFATLVVALVALLFTVPFMWLLNVIAPNRVGRQTSPSGRLPG